MVEVAACRAAKSFPTQSKPDRCYVLFTLGAGGRMDPKQFSKVPADYRIKKFGTRAWRIAGPTRDRPVFHFESYNGGGQGVRLPGRGRPRRLRRRGQVHPGQLPRPDRTLNPRVSGAEAPNPLDLSSAYGETSLSRVGPGAGRRPRRARAAAPAAGRPRTAGRGRGRSRPTWCPSPRAASSAPWTRSGSLFPFEEVTVGSEVEGRVDQVFVDVGDRVARGTGRW